MELTLKYILEENKLGSNRFLDALKKGNKDNLDLYFNFAKQHKINLFDYTTQTSKYNPLDSIVKYLNKELIGKDNKDCLNFLNEWFYYLKENGYSILQEKLTNYNNQNTQYFGYLNDYRSYYELLNKIRPSIRQQIDVSGFILKFTENESVERIKNPNKFIDMIDIRFFNNNSIVSLIKEIDKKNKLNISKIKSYKLMILEEEKIINVFQKVSNELRKINFNQKLEEHILYFLDYNGDNKVLYNLLQLEPQNFSKLNNIVLSEKIFNANKTNKQHFYILDNQATFFRYLDNIMYCNSQITDNKFKFTGNINMPVNYLTLASHFPELPNHFLKYNINNIDIKIFTQNILKELGIICEKELFKALFVIRKDNKYNLNTFNSNSFDYLIKNHISEKELIDNFEWLKDSYINDKLTDYSEYTYDIYHVQQTKINKKILSILEVLPDNLCNDFLNNLSLFKKINFLLSSDQLLNKYFKHDSFLINNFINNVEPDYQLEKKDLKTILIQYLKINKNISLTEPIENKINTFIESSYIQNTFSPDKNLAQKFMLDLELLSSTLNINNNIKKRL